MARYIVFYATTGAMRAELAGLPPERAAAGMELWMRWAGQVADRLVDLGSPLDAEGEADVQVSGYSILEADSQDELDCLLEDHPHRAEGGTISTQRFSEPPGT